jgi:hypothetical protein
VGTGLESDGEVGGVGGKERCVNLRSYCARGSNRMGRELRN